MLNVKNLKNTNTAAKRVEIKSKIAKSKHAIANFTTKIGELNKNMARFDKKIQEIKGGINT
jgi:hypothetical protein